MKTRAWLTFALGLVAGALFVGTIASASFGRFSLQLCPLPGTPLNQPTPEPGAKEGSWRAKE